MSAHSTSIATAAEARTGLCGEDRPSCYYELTPREFNARRELGVVVLKAPEAGREFQGFRAVFALACSSRIEQALADWPREAPLGLVCAEGDCSSRLAIRLARMGYTVYHLAGGLREWRRCHLA